MNKCPLMYFLQGDAPLPDYAPEQSRKAQVRGVDGKIGRLSTPCRGQYDLDLDASAYRVRPLPGADGVFLCILKESGVFDSAAFMRDRVYGGHAVELNGRAFEIPVARLALGGIGLPKRRVLAEDGTRGWEVEEEYAELCGFAERYYAAKSAGAGTFTDAELDLVCASAAGVNYRLGVAECIELGLFTDESMRAILDALIDWPEILRISEMLESKKKAAG